MSDSLFYIDLTKKTTERFDLARFMSFEGDNYDVITSYMLNELKGLKSGGVYTVRGEESRPDLLSYNIYGGSTQYWWIIMLYNGITNIADIKTGVELEFPQLKAIEDFYFTLKVKQNRSE